MRDSISRVPEGAIRYNTDSNKMEVWIGDKWMQVSVSAAGVAGGRGVFTSRYTPVSYTHLTLPTTPYV